MKKPLLASCILVIIELMVIIVPTTSASAAYYNEIFWTKFGDLTFINEYGKLSVSAVDVKLNGKTILSTRDRKDGMGGYLWLGLPYMVIAYEHAPHSKRTERPRKIDLIVIEEGHSADCAKHFFIIDFRMEKPFISEPFGDNPKDEYCLTVKKIEWGAKETYIYLFNEDKYLYLTGGKVIGPIYEENQK
jgi:hypothetical protein